MGGTVAGVSANRRHTFSKSPQLFIQLRAGLGVEGDAHAGRTVKHVYRMLRNPLQPNLRQVHLVHEELFAELAAKGFRVNPGDLGENITTRGIDLLALPRATRLRIGSAAVVELTGLRNPCVQIDRFQDGLMAAVLDRDADGNLVRKSGVMGIVISDGIIRADDSITIELPDGPHSPLPVV